MLINIRLAKYLFIFAAAFAVVVMGGWYENVAVLKTGFSAVATMKFNTALCLMATALAAYFLNTSNQNKLIRFWPLLSLGVLAVVSLSVLEGLTGRSFGIDELFVRDWASAGTRWAPGRPSPVTLVNLAIINLSIFGIQSRHVIFRKMAHGLILVAWVISFQAVIGYFEKVSATYGLALFTQMAVHTALLFGIICTGLIMSRPDEGLMKVITSSTEAGRISKALLFFAIFLPPTISWLEGVGTRLHFWNDEFGALIRIITQTIFFSWLAFRIGTSLLLSESKDRRTQEELRQAIIVRDEFLSIASHELRTPLTSMRLQSQFLQREMAKVDSPGSAIPRLKKMIDVTDQGILRMTRLVEDMLDISRIESRRLALNLEAVEFATFVNDCMSNYAAELLANKISYSLVVRGRAIVKIDRERIEQVIANLVTNTIKYAPGSKVVVTVNCTEAEAQLIFQDDGPGIAPKDHERIFNKFERLVSVKKVSGLGLGLHIAREIIKVHNGTIEVQSSLGHGARFIVTLATGGPRHEDQ